MDKVKVLIASPIHKENTILKEFLESLKRLNLTGIEISYCFIDDNDDEMSSLLIKAFKKVNKKVTLLDLEKKDTYSEIYYCDNNTHLWNNNLIGKVTYFKNEMIKYFLESDNEYIFFVDSDLVLHPNTLQVLLEQNKDIIAEIFWTIWSLGTSDMPQVWLKDFYTLYNAHMLRHITNEEAELEKREFINSLKKPGVYEVGGLGACTLIKRDPLEKGVNFTEISNLSFWGEDRHFCIRAVAMGYKLFVDTHCPALHLYRKSDLDRVEDYKASCYGIDYEKAKSEISKLLVEANYNNLEKNLIKSEIRNLSYIFNGKYTAVTCNYDLDESGYISNRSFKSTSKCKVILKRNKDVWKVSEYKVLGEKKEIEQPFIRIAKNKNNKLTLSMVVKNEEGRYLERALLEHKKYIDNAVIIDDGSTDKTIDIVKDILGDNNLTLIENNTSLFSNEIYLRKLQWIATINTGPDWILNLDADEIFEEKFSAEIENLINSDLEADGYAFRLYDFWNENQYRADEYWMAHTRYRPFLIRYQENFKYKWNESKLHCGRLPANIFETDIKLSWLRLKHMGWSREEDRKVKFARYMELDPLGTYGNINQYNSILDENPNLILWEE